MRLVTNVQFDALQAVMARASVELRAGASASVAANVELAGLIKSGRVFKPLLLGRRILKTDSKLQARLSAEVERAAVAFLGERRQSGENLAEYLDRLFGMCTDLSKVLAAQRANGLEYRP